MCGALVLLGTVVFFLAINVVLVFTPVFDLVVQGRNYALVRLFHNAWQTKPLMVHQQAVLRHLPAGTCLEVDNRLAAHLEEHRPALPAAGGSAPRTPCRPRHAPRAAPPPARG